jgi:hypothetical protein
MRAWQGQPRKMIGGRILAKKQAKMSIARLSVAIWWCWKEPLRKQSGCKILRHFKASPDEQLKVLGVLLQRRGACHFILNGAARNSALALH